MITIRALGINQFFFPIPFVIHSAKHDIPQLERIAQGCAQGIDVAVNDLDAAGMRAARTFLLYCTFCHFCFLASPYISILKLFFE
jgi:hypothetical protein